MKCRRKEGSKMIIDAKKAEEAGILNVAQEMCIAARTAPKTKGEDFLETCIVTGEEKDALAGKMEELSEKLGYKFFLRDAQNLRDSFAVVLLGIRNQYRGMNDGCGYCGFKNCGECSENGGMCAFGPIDLGIAIGSAVAVASGAGVDNRVMFSIGRAAAESGIFDEDVKELIGIPLSVSGKSPYFDRKMPK